MDFSGDPQETGNGIAENVKEGEIEASRLAQHLRWQVSVVVTRGRIRDQAAGCPDGRGYVWGGGPGGGTDEHGDGPPAQPPCFPATPAECGTRRAGVIDCDDDCRDVGRSVAWRTRLQARPRCPAAHGNLHRVLSG
jgi:hypothetical protein